MRNPDRSGQKNQNHAKRETAPVSGRRRQLKVHQFAEEVDSEDGKYAERGGSSEDSAEKAQSSGQWRTTIQPAVVDHGSDHAHQQDVERIKKRQPYEY